MAERNIKAASVSAVGITAGGITADHLVLKGTYLYPLRLGTMRIWQDVANGKIRIKIGSDPSSETDGNYINVT